MKNLDRKTLCIMTPLWLIGAELAHTPVTYVSFMAVSLLFALSALIADN